MPLGWQKVEIPFERGVDLGTHPFAIKPPLLQRVINGRFSQNGAIAKRNGYETTATVAGWPDRRLFSVGKSLLSVKERSLGIAPGNVKAALYALNASDARWDEQGLGDMVRAVSEATVREKRVISRDETYSQINGDVGYNALSGQKVIAWQSDDSSTSFTKDGRIYAVVIDNVTGATVVPQQLVGTHQFTDPHTAPRVVISATKAYVVYAIEQDTEIRAAVYDFVTRSWTSDVQLVSDYNAVSTGPPVNDSFDACALEGGSGEWYLAYRHDNGAGGHNLRINRYAADSTTAANNTTISKDPDSKAIGISAYSGEEVWVAFGTTDATRGLYAAAFDETDLSSVLSATAIETDAAFIAYNVATQRVAANKAVILWTDEWLGSGNDRATKLNFTTIDTGGTVDPSTAQQKYNAALISKPAIVEGELYVNVLYDGNVDGDSPALRRPSDGHACVLTLAVKDTLGLGDAESLQEWRVAARTLTASAGVMRDRSTLSNFVQTDSARQTHDFVASETFRISGFFAAPFDHDGIDLMRIDFAGDDRWMGAQVGSSLWLTGGVTMVYDGGHVSEHGFHFPPDNVEMSANGSGGSLSAGDYQVAVVWEFQGNDGTRWQSAPLLARTSSGVTSLTCVANDSIDLIVHPMTFTQKYNTLLPALSGEKDGQLALRVYRTIANGTTFYLEDAEIYQNSAIVTTGTTLTLTFLDNNISDNEQLYTTGGVLPNYPMPALDDIAFWKNRVWGIPSEDKTKVVFTKELVEGDLPSWHPFFEVTTNSDDDNTAIAALDDRLIVFKSDAIWAITGNGPDDKGLAGTLQAQQIASDQGCIDKRSVVLTPLGLMFQSRLGIMLLDRGLTVKFIGERVQGLVTTDVLIHSATALPDKNWVYFNMEDTAQDAGATVVYDWSLDEWVYDLVRLDPAESAEEPAKPGAAAFHNGEYFTVIDGSTENHVCKHTGFSDPGATEVFIPCSVHTGWIGVDGYQGFKRLRFVSVLGEYKDKHKLTVIVDTDYETAGPSNVWTDAQLQAFASPATHQPKVHVDNQRCQSFRVRIEDQEDDTNTGASEGAVYLGIAAEIGIKKGIRKLTDAHMR